MRFVWKQLTMCFTHTCPSQPCTMGVKDYAMVLFVSGVSVGTRKFPSDATRICLSPTVIGCPNIYSFCLSLFCSTRTFHESSVFISKTKKQRKPSKQKFFNTAYHLCVYEDKLIISKMISAVCQAFPNSQNKTHFKKGENSNIAKIYCSLKHSLQWNL